MSFRRKTRSIVLDRAQTRAASMQAIPGINEISGEVTFSAFNEAITDTRDKLNQYNSLLAQTDEARAAFLLAQKDLGDTSERMLSAVAHQYGRTSDYYVMAGGRRKTSIRSRSATVEPMDTSTPAESAA